jgi:hypothetical protein
MVTVNGLIESNKQTMAGRMNVELSRGYGLRIHVLKAEDPIRAQIWLG